MTSRSDNAADMDKINADDVNYLRFFQGGQTISAFLAAFDTDELMLLDRAEKLIAEEHLMTREEFDSHTTEQEREIADTGLKTVFKKLFRSKEEEVKKPRKKSPKKSDSKDPGDDIAAFAEERKKLDQLFDKSLLDAASLRQKIEKI